MIGIPCSWCDEIITIVAESLAADTLDCQRCCTRVELAPAQQTACKVALVAVLDQELRAAA